MGASNPKPETTLVVILGASQFPNIKLFKANPAFKTSAKAFRHYLLSSNGFDLPKENLLDLFNIADSPSDVDERIADFLKVRSQALSISGKSLLDVLVYYVGHGGFTDDGGYPEYFLTLLNTREEQKRSSGYLIRSLATTLKRFATHQRKYLILDCCFSAAAYEAFQSAPLQVVVEQTLENFEYASKGTAFLCAASKAEPAKSPYGQTYTMFSTALLQILNEGVKNHPDALSFRQLGELINIRVREIFQDEAIRPQVHSPDQRQGDIARIPFFPNSFEKVRPDEASQDELSNSPDVTEYKKWPREIEDLSQEAAFSIPQRIKNLLRTQIWKGPIGVVTIIIFIAIVLALFWSTYTFTPQTSDPTATSTTLVNSSNIDALSQDEPTALPTNIITPSTIPSEVSSITSNVTPIMLNGVLAIPVKFRSSTKVYLTNFDGYGINGPNPISLDAQQPIFTRDGKFIVTKATIDGETGVYKFTASGFNPQILIRRDGAEWPVVSPDGKIIIFAEARLDYRLFKRIPDSTIPDGTIDSGIIQEISLNGFPIFAKNLLWSDENELFFQGCATWKNQPDECGIWIADTDNLNPVRLVKGNDVQPMAIKNNVLVYTSREEGDDWDIFIMRFRDDGESKNLTDNNFEDGLPAISPDGTTIAYISNESGIWGLWTVNLDGKNKTHWFDIDSTQGIFFEIDEWSSERMSWRR